MRPLKSTKPLAFMILALCLFSARPAGALSICDDAGQHLIFYSPPLRVVSIVPSATEIICALGACRSLAGITYHDSHLPEIPAETPIVGGAFTPQFSIINGLSPDLLIAAPRDFEKAQANRGDLTYPILVVDDSLSLAQAEKRLEMLGDIFQLPHKARKIISDNHELLETIKLKTNKIKKQDRRKAMRLLLTEEGLMTTGADSFQTELIQAAGAQAPNFGQGPFAPLNLAAWQEFNPYLVFACDENAKEIREFLSQSGWNEVEAVKSGRIHSFPCALAGRAATNTGHFAAWLSSVIYDDKFADESKLIHPQEVLGETQLDIDFDFVAKARLVDSRLMDFVHRTLLIDFKRPQNIMSSTGGAKSGILLVGNSFVPPPTWSIYHRLGFERSFSILSQVLDIEPQKSEIMLTGADLNNLAVKTKGYKDMLVSALVTAGVEGNALRSSRDAGAWYEPGTINIIVISNHQLSDQAAARALITITEAKTAALWDMDIRSVQTPLQNPATGTGTDSIIVVSGEGPLIEATGGHSKMGQLMAEAVHEAVVEAIRKQNGKLAKRNVFERLAERGLNPAAWGGGPGRVGEHPLRNFQADLELALMQAKYQGFLEAAFSLSDAHLMGQINDLSAFEAWAGQIAADLAGRPIDKLEDITGRQDIPPALKIALDAIGSGVKYKSTQ